MCMSGIDMYEMSHEEKEYLKQYDITKYERPSVAADMAVFSVMNEQRGEEIRDRENYRKLPQKKLKILLIKRGTYPYKDCWALPGGFCRKGEDVLAAAYRELFEETQVKDAYLDLVGTFGEEGRDPRGWIISNTFLALFDGEKCRLRAGSDAWDARWFDVDYEKENVVEYSTENVVRYDAEKVEEYGTENVKEYEQENVEEYNKENVAGKHETSADKKVIMHHLKLINRDEGTPIVLEAAVKEKRCMQNIYVKTEYEIEKENGLAFDHAKIITYALSFLRNQVQSDGRIVFHIMPEYFTLTELQNAFEVILGKELLTANFRRKMTDYVVETEQMIEGAGHRPAKLFKRNMKTLFMDGE